MTSSLYQYSEYHAGLCLIMEAVQELPQIRVESEIVLQN